ncbi:MAG TPA: S1/P1 nuclease [Gemmatimonadaceae bacterium]|nr:S1/P1 nuclease [Gemmatimonadaceae bacterium]
MRRTLAAIAIVSAAVLVLPQLLSAWNATGHRTIADIAWEHMTPTARARAVELLMHGPPLADLASLRPSTGTDPERDRALFMNAATWPDLIRDRNMPWYAYNHPTWHYADFYWDVENGQPHDIPGTGPDSSNAGERIIAFRNALSDPTVPDTTKAVDLAWILHLVGDIHQPLHASSRVTPQNPLPSGDKGGNDFVLSDPRHRLHGFWDNILDESIARAPGEDSTAYASRLAATIEQMHPLSALRVQADSLDVATWEHESLVIAQRDAYSGITPGTAPSAAYQAAALAVSEARIALAGYRLAALLNAALR